MCSFEPRRLLTPCEEVGSIEEYKAVISEGALQ
jgi:hypothetical protein